MHEWIGAAELMRRVYTHSSSDARLLPTTGSAPRCESCLLFAGMLHSNMTQRKQIAASHWDVPSSDPLRVTALTHRSEQTLRTAGDTIQKLQVVFFTSCQFVGKQKTWRSAEITQCAAFYTIHKLEINISFTTDHRNVLNSQIDIFWSIMSATHTICKNLFQVQQKAVKVSDMSQKHLED